MSRRIKVRMSHVAEMPAKRQFRFEKLTVWQSARQLCGEIYELTRSFPKEEMFGLTSQLRRAVVSISTNIAEGSGRNSDADFAHFLEISYGSAMEVASLVHIAADFGYVNPATREHLIALISEVTAQLSALNRSLTVFHSKTPFARQS